MSLNLPFDGRSLLVLVFLLGAGSTGCATNTQPMGRVIQPNGVTTSGDWSEAELQQELAIRHLRRTEHASFHRVRALGRERPHVHDRHDLTVFVLSGRVLVHLGEQTVEARAGDVIDIPKGVVHWVENQEAPAASEAFNVFSPPFDGKDRRFVAAAQAGP